IRDSSETGVQTCALPICFGLFGDHVLSLEIVDHDGNSKEVTKATNPELFYAILGGSPGNFGVLTHFTIEVHRDSDYNGSRGLKEIGRASCRERCSYRRVT